MTILPDMPRWIPNVGPGTRERPTPEVSHHMLLPRRWAAVSRRPTTAARISPGRCGRHTKVSESSTSTIGRPNAARSITARADSTSGSSGTSTILLGAASRKRVAPSPGLTGQARRLDCDYRRARPRLRAARRSEGGSMPRARLARFAIAAILLALTATGCSTMVSGAGQLVAPSTAPDATLAVVGDGHTSFDRLARNSIADIVAFWKKQFPHIAGKSLPPLTGKIYSVDDSDISAG